MGSFNISDGVTQLPIHHGDNIRVFILGQNFYSYKMGHGSYTRSNAYWYPMSFSIKGEYDSYGSLEKSIPSNIVNDISLNNIKMQLKQIDQSIDKLTMLDLINEINRGKAKIYDPPNYTIYKTKEFDDFDAINTKITSSSSLGYMMVLEDIYQTMIKYNPIEPNRFFNGSKVNNYEIIYTPRVQVFNDCINYVYNSNLELAKKIDLKNYSIQSMHAQMDMYQSWDEIYKDPALFNGITCYLKFLESKVMAQVPFEDVEVQEVVTQFVEFLLFNAAMDDASKLWMPQQSSREGNTIDINFALIKTMHKICRDKDSEEFSRSYIYKDWQLEHNAKIKHKFGIK